MVDVLLFELRLAVFSALFAIFFTGFFGPIQPMRTLAWLKLSEWLPNWASGLLTLLYCPKCLSFWTGALAALLHGGGPFSIAFVAMASSSIAFFWVDRFDELEEGT